MSIAEVHTTLAVHETDLVRADWSHGPVLAAHDAMKRFRLREQVRRDPTPHLVGLLRLRTTVIAVLVSRVAFLHTGTEAAQCLQHDARLRCDTRQWQSNVLQGLHLANSVR